MTSPSFYISTPIYYVNDVPHIGHAYTTLACDAMARFKRLDGYEVMFLTGTDEHGQKVETAAENAGMDPLAFTTQVSQNFRDLLPALNVSNDDFIRTTEERHIKSVQEIWRRLIAKGHIYLGKYAGWYSVRDEAYFAESELVDGIAPTGAPVEWVEEPSYFFDLSKWQEPLLKFYDENPSFVAPNARRNEVISFVSGGLRDLSVSRTSFKWGVPVPDDDAHIMYVWLDALTNYITATGFPDTDSKTYKKFWPANIHMVGKDILRFHAVYWPAFLMAAGLPLPGRVFAHGWWTNEGQKISKSLGNVIDPLELIETYGLDQMRYFLLREVPFGNDGDLSRAAMVRRMNNDLANDFGNLSQRVLGFIAKNVDAAVPTPGAFNEADTTILKEADRLLAKTREAYDEQAFNRALEGIWEVISGANRYIDDQAPWALRKTDPKRMATVLFTLLEVIRHLAILMQPVIPGSANTMLDQLGVGPDARNFTHLTAEYRVAPGTPLPKPAPIFPRHVAAE
ncbi:MAG: methionine--tRNA ligase [Alphaproteobacteria bacterium]|nr:methionine--tRNA ligase [Alphaproteobacteria bacterium]